MDSLKSGSREIQQGEISLAGTREAHILKVQAQNKLSKFYVQLAGGFNAQNNWLGQIQRVILTLYVHVWCNVKMHLLFIIQPKLKSL